MSEQKVSGLMTSGSITKHLIIFSIPLLLGNLFQQLYNAVDSAIVGHFIGDNALAAVGSSAPVTNLLVSFFMGIGIGASVIIAKYFGAREKDKLSRSLHTAIAFIIIVGILMSIVGYFACGTILKFINTPAEVMSEATTYLKIIFIGNIFTMFYNMASGILRAVGDSKHPLYYLIISTIINVILDLVFIVYFKSGIAGAAYATIIAQGVSALLTLWQLSTTKQEYRFSFKQLSLDKEMLSEIIRVGIPSGIQNGIVSFSNLVVQGNINSFGSIAMAGCSAYSKIDGFAILPVLSYANALTTFTSQNIGAKKIDRFKKGVRSGLILSITTTLVISLCLILFSDKLLTLFSNDREVIKYGIYQMQILAPCYFLLAISHAFNGIIRGSGKTKVPMIVMIVCWCLMRMAWITISVPIFNDIRVVFMGWPITWLASTILFIIYYKKGNWANA